MRTVLIAFFAAAAVAAWAAPVRAAQLTVVIENLRSGNGVVRIALWSRAEGFTDADEALIRTERPAASGKVRFDLGELAPGRYAIATYHDENGDGKFDRSWLGLPDEGLGFSNGAWIGLSAPSFKEAAFDLKPASQTQVVEVRMRYPGDKPIAHRSQSMR